MRYTKGGLNRRRGGTCKGRREEWETCEAGCSGVDRIIRLTDPR